MNKGEFIKAWAEKACMTQKEAGVAYDKAFEVIAEALKKGDKVQLMGFGTFELRKKAASVRFNPQTKGKVEVPARLVPAFKAGKLFKDMFN